MASGMIQPVDQIRDRPRHREHHHDHQRHGDPDRRHQKEFPMNGSMWPQNSTAAQMTIADAAAIFAENGASSPAPTDHASSTSMKYRMLMPPRMTNTIFQ